MSERVAAADLSRAEALSLLAWWIDAGVDLAVQEEPRDWRRKSPPAAEPQAASAIAPEASAPSPVAPIARVPGGGASDLDSFHAWLAESADLPLFRAGAARALPYGPANAELMLLTGIPAPGDAAEGKPIGGLALLLTERMLRAAGLDPAAVYIAAQTCFSGTGTRFSEADSAACRDTILAQIALAAPKRLLLLGDHPSKLLLGQPMATARGKLHRIAGIPTAVTFPPHHLLANSGHKALAWADLLLIMGD